MVEQVTGLPMSETGASKRRRLRKRNGPFPPGGELVCGSNLRGYWGWAKAFHLGGEALEGGLPGDECSVMIARVDPGFQAGVESLQMLGKREGKKLGAHGAEPPFTFSRPSVDRGWSGSRQSQRSVFGPGVGTERRPVVT